MGQERKIGEGMIYVPKREECAIWNETENGVYILYYVDGNESREVPIRFVWGRTPVKSVGGELEYCKEYDPFYLRVEECMMDVVLGCPMVVCNAKPQLRYNGIIRKWYCCCPSSVLGVGNDDESEIEKLINGEKYKKENGFCDDPVEAIMRWNESCAKDYLSIARNNIRKYWKIIKNKEKK